MDENQPALRAPRIFISYRRDDSAGHAGRLYDALSARFGPENVFRDLDTLASGVDFRVAIREAVGSCDVLFVVIGPRWLTIEDAQGRRRLDDPNDLVRLEIKAGLELGLLVIPVLVQDAKMPTADDLPNDIAGLAGKNAPSLHEDAWHDAVNRLIAEIDRAPRRVDWHAEGWAKYGSQLQCQLYVNCAPDALSAAVLSALPSIERRKPRLRWCVPLREQSFYEPRDGEMLSALGHGHLRRQLAECWPARGPRWDALAICEFPDGEPGALLAEGKSYAREMYGGGTKAGPESRAKIERCVAWAQEQLGLEPDPDRWLSSLYQTANRLTHAVWLNAHGVDTWFCHLLFTNDPTHSRSRRTTEERWMTALAEAERELGIDGIEIPYLGHALLPGLDPNEVVPDR